MKWSFSADRSFRRCQRQWFIQYTVASPQAKRPRVRREAYLLSKLDSLYAWRGRLVDHVISNLVVPHLAQGRVPSVVPLLRNARQLFERQLACARSHRLREPGIVLSKTGPDFAAFRSVEYGEPLDDAKLEDSWADVERALRNLIDMPHLLDQLSRARRLIAQRRLQFTIVGLSGEAICVHATPDLIVFSTGESPLVIDWKVHTFAITDYRLQLACYALTLARSKPHRDFPSGVYPLAPTEVRLLEVQLLSGSCREHHMESRDFDETESFIAESAERMALALHNDSADEITPLDLPPAGDPSLCERCPYQKICWGDEEWRASSQMSLF